MIFCIYSRICADVEVASDHDAVYEPDLGALSQVFTDPEEVKCLTQVWLNLFFLCLCSYMLGSLEVCSGYRKTRAGEAPNLSFNNIGNIAD